MEKKYTATEAGVMAVFAPMVVVGMLIAFLPLSLWSTWVELKLWHWFIVPYLGFRDIPYWALFGVNIFIAQYGYRDHAKDRKTSTASIFVTGVSVPAIALLYGWAVHTYLLK